MSKPAAQILVCRPDPSPRPGSETELSHQDQIDRLELGMEMGIKIERVITHANDDWVTAVWNMYSEKDVAGMKMCGIEVFKVENGVLSHAWNTPYAEGRWNDFD